MKIRIIKSLICASLLWASQTQAVTMLSPADGDIVTSKTTLRFQVEGGEKLGKNLSVLLNGRDITRDAVASTAIDGRFKVRKGTVGLHLKKGENNVIFIKKSDDFPNGEISNASRFQFDKGGPLISVAQIKKVSNSKIKIKILADDPVGTSAVWVNGKVADQIRDGVFSVTVKEKGQYQVVAEDVKGNSETILYSNDAGRLKDSIAATIANDNLEPIADLTELMMTQYNIADYVQNPIYNGSPDSGLIKHVTFNIVDAHYGRPDISLRSDGGQLRMVANIPQMTLSVEGVSTGCFIICITVPVYGTIEVDSAQINANVIMSATNGSIGVSLTNFATTLGNHYFHSNWEWFSLIQSIINGITAQILPSSFQEAIKGPVENILRAEFNKLDTHLYASVFGTDATIDAVLQDIRPINGGLELRAEADVEIKGSGGKKGLGFREKQTGIPSLAASSGMSAGVSVDLPNQMIW